MKTPILQRLNAKTSYTNGCRIWTGYTVGMGYGRIGYEGKQQLTHVLSFKLFKGPIPKGLCVLHHCDVPACWEPAHLFLGTKADNNRDMAAKGRHGQQRKKTCKNNHPLDGVRPTGQRYCRECNRQLHRQWLNKQRKNVA